MKKLFTQKLKLCAALCALFALGCPNIAAEELADGYYYIINANTDGGTKAFRVSNHQLRWNFFDETQPDQIFYLKKAKTNEALSTEHAGQEYFIQNYAEGSWFYGQTNTFSLEMRVNDNKETMRFVPLSDGTFHIRATLDRSDKKNQETQYLSTYRTDGVTKWENYGRDNVYMSLWQCAEKNGNYWNIKKVSDNQLKIASQKNALIKAYELYNAQLSYNESTTKLINNANATNNWGTGSQFLVSSNQDNAQKFASLINGGMTSTDNFQTNFGTNAKYPDGKTVELPQFIQVDLGENVNSKGVKMEYGLANYNANGWGASSQMYDVTLYATNDATAATGDYTLAACAADANWDKIGESLLDLSQSVKYDNLSASWSTKTRTTRYTWQNLSGKNIYIYENFGLKGNSYRYLRFYVNSTLFPNSQNMNFMIGELQFYNLDDINIIGSKRYVVNNMLQAANDVEAGMKTYSPNSSSENEVAALTANIDKLTDAIEAVEKNASVSITDIGYSTFVSDEKVQLPTDSKLKAYIVKSQDGNYAVLEKIAEAGQTIPANTPVLIKGDKGDYVLPISTADAVSITDQNLLKGEARAITTQADGTTYYTLQNRDGKAVFKKYNPSLKLNAGYAYLPVTTSAASPALLNISFDAATGIQSAVNAETKDAKTYDLEGRSVKNPQKGIYIRGGKKVVIK